MISEKDINILIEEFTNFIDDRQNQANKKYWLEKNSSC